MRVYKKKLLAVAGVLLTGCVLLLTRNHSPRKSRSQFQWGSSPLVNPDSWLDSGNFLPLNVTYEVLAGSVPAQQRFLSIGISSVQRTKGRYLGATLESIFSQSSAEEREDLVVVVLLADFDLSWRSSVTEEIHKTFPSQLASGQLLLIHAPQDFYPPLTGLKRNYNDAADRVTFRSKQNIDYSFLVNYSHALGRFYLQLEDDVYVAKNFLSKIRRRIDEQNAKKPAWCCLEFSSLGYIGKLYKSDDMPLLARFLFLFYQEMPCDWLMSRFRDLLTQKAPIIFKPSLFQHMGTFSSFKGTHNKLKDKDFEEFTNPEAEVYTNMSVYEKHAAQFAWNPGADFFWAHSPQPGHYLTVVLKEPAVLTDVEVETGDGGKDMLASAQVELGRDVVDLDKEKSCRDFVILGRLERGRFEAQDLDKTHASASSCLRIRVTAAQSEWVMIKKMRVATRSQTKTSS